MTGLSPDRAPAKTEPAAFGPAAEAFARFVADSVGDDTDVRVGPPRPSDQARGIDASFVRLVTDRPVEADQVRHIAGKLTLLVSVDDHHPGAIDLLDELIAALDGTPYELAASSVDSGWWLAHGVTPRPCLEVAVPGVIDRALAEPQRVREVEVAARHLHPT